MFLTFLIYYYKRITFLYIASQSYVNQARGCYLLGVGLPGTLLEGGLSWTTAEAFDSKSAGLVVIKQSKVSGKLKLTSWFDCCVSSMAASWKRNAL